MSNRSSYDDDMRKPNAIATTPKMGGSMLVLSSDSWKVGSPPPNAITPIEDIQKPQPWIARNRPPNSTPFKSNSESDLLHNNNNNTTSSSNNTTTTTTTGTPITSSTSGSMINGIKHSQSSGSIIEPKQAQSPNTSNHSSNNSNNSSPSTQTGPSRKDTLRDIFKLNSNNSNNSKEGGERKGSATKIKDKLMEKINNTRDVGRKEMVITGPYEVKHEVHVDEKLSGLPPEWMAMIKSSGISPVDAAKNVNKLKNVIAFSTRINDPKSLMSRVQPLPQDANLTLDSFVSNEDPTKLYIAEKKIGEGYVFFSLFIKLIIAKIIKQLI